jgi:hypothetical protein
MVNRIRSGNTSNNQGRSQLSPSEVVASNGFHRNGNTENHYAAEQNGKQNGMSPEALLSEPSHDPHLSGDPFFDSLLTKQGSTLRRQLATTILPGVLGLWE